MIWFWRGLVLFSILNLINIIVVDGGAGMEFVWIFIIIGSLILSFKHPYELLFSKKWIKIPFIIMSILFLFVEGSIILNGIALNPPKNVDYLVVLGARIRGEVPSLTLQYRLDKAYTYLVNNPDTMVIVSGGRGVGESITEAEAMKRYLVKKGIKENRILLEPRARDTDENLRYAFEIMDAQQEDASSLVVTSSFHVLRSKMIAKDLGRQVGGIGSKTLPYLIPTYYLREFFAVVEEFIF